MADNVSTSSGTLATDEINSIHYPRSKVGFGPDGSYSDVGPNNPLPIADATSGPGASWANINPADANLSKTPRALFVATGGTLVLRGSDGVDATFTVASGTILPVRPVQVRAASTASGIVAIY